MPDSNMLMPPDWLWWMQNQQGGQQVASNKRNKVPGFVTPQQPYGAPATTRSPMTPQDIQDILNNDPNGRTPEGRQLQEILRQLMRPQPPQPYYQPPEQYYPTFGPMWGGKSMMG